MVKMPWAQTCGMHVGLEVSLLICPPHFILNALYSRPSDIQFESTIAGLEAFAI